MKKLAVVWKSGPVAGTVEAVNGTVSHLGSAAGSVTDNSFRIPAAGPLRLTLHIAAEHERPAANSALLSVLCKDNPFSFFPDDVSRDNPIWIPAYGVAVTAAGDPRRYDEIEEDIRSRGLRTQLQQIADEPEESYEKAAAATRDMMCPTWLGLSRDVRIFSIGYGEHDRYWGYVRATYHQSFLPIPEANGADVRYEFALARGAACSNQIARRLEDGFLPILLSRADDDDVQYDLAAFVTLEKSALTAKNNRGTHFLVADGYSLGHFFTDEQREEFFRLQPAEMARDEETVLYCRAVAVNTAKVPRYAWFMCPRPTFPCKSSFEKGHGIFSDSGRVFCVSRMNGSLMHQPETAVLLQPGATCTMEFFLPHQPLPRERAEALAQADFDARKAECREFWLEKLNSGASIETPEPILNEMVKAGLLHLNMISYGNEPDGPIAAMVGVYSPIGSESSPIIQAYDSMGHHDTARRALQYFLEKQHDDGFMQNFNTYMLETGAALWCMGEHYRYTRDTAWVESIAGKLVSACEYMRVWRKKNMKKGLRGVGYGMLDGKTADPEDPFHSFMLNGYAYLGMARTAEMLRELQPEESERWSAEAEALKKSIRETFFNVMARSPVVPLGDGSWVPTAPPWGESVGPCALFAAPDRCWTHGSFVVRDSLLGPLYLVFQEVIVPDEPAADFLLQWHADLMCRRNVAFSQPYYCRNATVHLLRGETKAFLKTFYNGLTGLSDRETYTWWEHYFHVSPHKTHEEAWFLMQFRQMLWLERGGELHLLSGIPRKWLEQGNRIRLSNVASYFGPLSLVVTSELEAGRIVAELECRGERKPETVVIRLPLPDGKTAVTAQGGDYDAKLESVRIDGFTGSARVVLEV